ncbi:hypothetical protein FM996_17970 [Methylosinus sporium]|uniref:Uncharacterized protein n=1 Tax=Methylosinus sporium TaxID=428 RepID=A0A549SH61_METSR|nr:hypothetical protein [Methylosinus sporium]TRL28965.1 hypothetical protein FM996_17970 [Methylosinus sporium]
MGDRFDPWGGMPANRPRPYFEPRKRAPTLDDSPPAEASKQPWTDRSRDADPWEGRRQRPEPPFLIDRNVRRANIALAITFVLAVCVKAGLFQPAYDFLVPDTSPPVPIREGVQWTTASRTAMNPLTIASPSGNKSFAIKVVEEGSNRQIALLFIGPGRRAETRLDPGVYKLRVATGIIWRGGARLFGRETQCFETTPMQFTVGTNGYGGQSVRLDDTLVGNLQKSQIRKDAF